jgi:hypothetical protein
MGARSRSMQRLHQHQRRRVRVDAQTWVQETVPLIESEIFHFVFRRGI